MSDNPIPPHVEVALEILAGLTWDNLVENLRVNARVLGCPECNLDLILSSRAMRANWHSRQHHSSDEAWIEENISTYREGLTLYAQTANNEQPHPQPTVSGSGTA